ncbi:MAG: PHP domain-containing protein [Gracilibacteraceae bacterium]|nr:PHP domain-containing protein [Gracilibacteraceae bacterium]
MKQCGASYEADLHTHTTASDGELTPAELTRRAAGRGVRVLAVTDHDTLSGLPAAAAAAAAAGIEFWPGVEINTSWRGREIHVLGYLPELFDPLLEKRLADTRAKRFERLGKIVAKLNSLGINIRLEDVRQEVTGATPGRPHVARALCRGGHAADIDDAFRRWLNRDAPAFVPRYPLTPEEAVAWIREAGGLPVIAHPGDAALTAAEIAQWKPCGLRGLEARHPHHNNDQTAKYLRWADQLGLLRAGGSDFHGPKTRPDIEPGCCGLTLAEAATLRRELSGN